MILDSRVDEYWEPETEGLETIVVKREIPCIHILISLDEFDKTAPGYQNSGTKTSFWIQKAISKATSGNLNHPGSGPHKAQKNQKRNQNGGNRGPRDTNKKPKAKEEVVETG